MANVNGSWVVASSKKGKGTNVSPSFKGKKKPATEGMPRIEPSVPVEESPTIYSLFMQEEEKKERRLEREQQAASSSKPMSNAAGPTMAPKKGAQVQKKAADKKKEKVPTLDEALNEVMVADLQSVIVKDKATFPDHPDVWLKDLVSVLNLKLDKLPTTTDPTFSDKPYDYPSCSLPKQLKSFLLDTLSKMSPQTLHLFLDHCIQSMMNDVMKGLPIYGFHIYIQLLLSFKPNIGISSLPTYLALLKDNVTRPQRALCIMWCMGQAGLTDLSSGLKVWFELMLPFLNIRTLAPFAVHYLESLFRRHQKALNSANIAFPKREFFKLFDELYSQQPTINVELRGRLLKIYPQLKMVAIGSRPDTSSCHYFSSFLSRCTVDCQGPKKTELLSCLSTCLLVDKQSFSVWRQIYVKNLAQSSVLMRYLADNLDSSMSNIDRRLLRETVRAFHITNDDLTSSSSTTSVPAAELQLCVNSCQDLLNPLCRPQSPSQLLAILTMVLVILLLALSADIYTSKSFHDCRTVRFLQDVGAVAFVEQAWQRLVLYSTKAWSWLATTIPVYWSNVSSIVLPYFTLASQRLSHLASVLWQASQPVLQLCSDYIGKLTIWLDSKLPWLLELLSIYLNAVFNFTFQLFEYCAYGFHVCIDWILKNVLAGSLSPENIMKTISTLLTSVNSAVIQLYQWTLSHFN